MIAERATTCTSLGAFMSYESEQFPILGTEVDALVGDKPDLPPRSSLGGSAPAGAGSRAVH